MPHVDGKVKRPGWSVEIIALSLSNSIAEGLTRWLQQRGDLGGTKGGSGRRGIGNREMLLTPFGMRCMRSMIEGIERGRCFVIRSLVSLGQVAKKPLSIALFKVDLAAELAVA